MPRTAWIIVIMLLKCKYAMQIDTMKQQLDSTRNPHQKLEFFEICVMTTLAQMGQIISSLEKQELIMLEITLGNLCHQFLSISY